MSRRRLAAITLLALLGCKGAAVDPSDSGGDPNADADGDGLTDAFERSIGTSVDAADSDGDGCEDAVEVLSYFDPNDAQDRPNVGAYPRGPRPSEARFAELAEAYGEGFAEGELNANWRLIDQHGQEVELRDFYGQVVVIDIAAEWCGPCRQSAPLLEAFYQDNQERGFVVLQILVEGVVDNSAPQLDRWAEGLGLTYPVLSDHSPGDRFVTEVAQHYIDVPTASYEIPNYSLIDREHRVRTLYEVGSPEEDVLRSMLEEPTPEVEVLLPEDAAALREALGLSAEGWVVGPEVCGE